MEGLENIPNLIDSIKNNTKVIDQIVYDFRYIGYDISKIDVKESNLPGFPHPINITYVKENDMKCETDQLKMSQGMYRALSLIVIINYLLSLEKPCTVIVDDVGEGLDFKDLET